MASDPDACLPDSVKDFVFDLHDSVRRSQVPAEQGSFYKGTFREVTAKYFATSAWPSPEAISSECGGDTLFLALYKEITHRHLHSVTRPQVHDRIDGWHVYRTLFDLLLAECPDGADDTKRPDSLYILPEWAFDILHEFVYQFQGFCQFRMSTFATAVKHASPDSAKPTPHHVSEAIEALSQNRDAWAVETVLFYLHRLVAVGTGSSTNVGPTFQYLGLFASVALSRLECLLGDYRASLGALSPVYQPGTVTAGDETKSFEEVVNGVFPARLSLVYHAGVSYLMLRRYKDATSVLGNLCSYMQRGFKTGQLRKIPGSEQFNKLYDRMISLLAILTHVCPTEGLVEDSVARAIRDKHGGQLSKIEAGEEGYEDLFIFACPKFVSPAVPDYGQANAAGAAAAAATAGAQDAYKLQVKQFMNEMSSQQTLRKLRSYMKLYTSIGVGKLAAFNDTQEEEFLSLLLCYKHKMRQLEGSGDAGQATLDGQIGTALDIHYYISGDMVHVDEAEKQRRFENYFMAQIAQNDEILKDVEAISTKV